MKSKLNTILNRGVQSLILITGVSLLSACSTYKVAPLGTIPKPAPVASEQTTQTRLAIVAEAQHEGHKVLKSGPEYVRVKKILSKLYRAAGVGDSYWPFYVVDAGDYVNASAVNQNSIVVYKKLLERVKSDAELSAILAHEVGHILGQHKDDEDKEDKAFGVALLGNALGTIAANAAYVGAGSVGLGNLAGNLTDEATNLIGQGVILEYDRNQEREADQIGLIIMAKAGYDPKAAVTFWARAEEVFGNDNGGFFSTHPSHDSRSEELEEALPKAYEFYRK